MSLKGIPKRKCSRLASCSNNYANTWRKSKVLSAFSRIFDSIVISDIILYLFNWFRSLSIVSTFFNQTSSHFLDPVFFSRLHTDGVISACKRMTPVDEKHKKFRVEAFPFHRKLIKRHPLHTIEAEILQLRFHRLSCARSPFSVMCTVRCAISPAVLFAVDSH